VRPRRLPVRLPILPTVAASYRDWWRMLFALHAVMTSAFLILLAIAAVAEFVPQRLWDQQLAGEALGLIQDALWVVLLAPVVIAIHRFVILGETTRAYSFPVGKPVFRSFLGWLFALKVLAGLPFDLLGLLQTLGLSLGASSLGFAVALIAAAAVSLRLTILLPALAVMAPGASAAHALADTRGQALRILAIFGLALLPWVAATVGGVIALGRGIAVTGSPQMMIGLVMGGVLQTAMLSLTAVIASHAFMALAAQLKRSTAPLPGAIA
jgi:hypothetical protein